MTGAYWPRFRSYDMESQQSLIAALDVTRQPGLGRVHDAAAAYSEIHEGRRTCRKGAVAADGL